MVNSAGIPVHLLSAFILGFEFHHTFPGYHPGSGGRGTAFGTKATEPYTQPVCACSAPLLLFNGLTLQVRVTIKFCLTQPGDVEAARSN